MQQVSMAKSIKNDMWISSEDKENPDVLPDLPGYHILVRPVSIKEKTKGGILLPDSTRDDMAYLTTVGQVVAMGDLAYHDMEKFPKGPWCELDDYVCYGKHAGQKIHPSKNSQPKIHLSNKYIHQKVYPSKIHP